MRAFAQTSSRTPSASGRRSSAAEREPRPAPPRTGSRLAQNFAATPAHASLPFRDVIQRSFGHHDISNVSAHTDAATARSLGAEAFTRGAEMTFAGRPTLHTTAHEAAHVVQQRAGTTSSASGSASDAHERHADAVADRVARGEPVEALLDAAPRSAPPRIQLRRVPPNIRALLIASGGAPGANATANTEGVERLIERAMAELTPAEQTTVTTTRRGPLTPAQFLALSRQEKLTRTAEAIRAVRPDLELGDPVLIDTGPRPATTDTANLNTAVTAANTIFMLIASGMLDASLTEVFGAGSIAAAKTKYANGRTWMNSLHAAGKILTDRSGYSGEVSLGGLTTFHQVIRVQPSVIDIPTSQESVVTLMHESLHAGNNDVSDNGYINAPQFTTRSEAEKLLNAAHFEVVPRRVLGAAFAFAGVTFVPAGTTVGGVTAPLPTAAEQGARAASERLRQAWTIGLNLHTVYVRLFRTPTDWTVPQPTLGGIRFDHSLPFWSKVQKLTIHRKSSIVPASPDAARHPVSQIDVALSEGLTRKLAAGMFLLDPLGTQAQILTFESARSSAAERTAAFPGGAHTNANRERDFLLRLTLRDPAIGPMTGPLARDLRVAERMGDAALITWADILAVRDPATFAD